MKDARTKRGFTVVEVMIAVVVMMMGVGLLMSVTGQMLDFSKEEQMQNEVEREMTLFLDYLERDIKSAAGVIVDYPAASPSAQALTLRMPEFEPSGLPKVPMAYHYVVYEYFYDTGQTTRTVYADELGEMMVDQMLIDSGPCYFVALADWQPLDTVIAPDDIDKIQVAVLRYEYENGRHFYYRSFVMESLMRNQL